jgi:hypothetical protein
MKLHPWLLAPAVIAGCGLVNSNTLSRSYEFDPQGFMESFGPASNDTVPAAACDPAAASGPCDALQASLPMSSPANLSCDATSRMCAAVVDVRLAYPVDLTMQSQGLPSEVVQYGVDKVSIQKIAYWIMNNQVNVEIPPIDLYVASAAAKDESDPSAKLIGTIAKLPPGSQCTDSADPAGDKAAPSSAAVCDIKLTDAGQAALAGFVKDYKTPFQFIAHTKVVAHGGDPLPAGDLAFFVRPTVQFSILK